MAEDNLNESRGIFSSVLGLVSREIQDFVVTAVTGSSTTLSHQPLQNHGNAKHKRSRSMNSSLHALPSDQAKRKRRPSSPHPKNLDEDECTEDPAGSDQEENEIQDPVKQHDRYSLNNEVGGRPGPSKRPTKASRRVSNGGGAFKMPELPIRATMPGSLWPRSPTPAEWNRKTLYPEVPAPTSTAKPALSTTPTISPTVQRDHSPDSSRPPKRPRSRRRSSVRFAPQVVRHPPPPERSPTPGAEAPVPPPNETTSTSTDATQPTSPRVKVEEDDEIIILDKMPTPPHGSALPSRGRFIQASKALVSSRAGASSSNNLPSGAVSSEHGEEPDPLQPNLADMSISELAWSSKTTTRDKGKEVDRQAPERNATNPPTDDEAHSSENDRIRQLEEEIERLKNELSFRSSTNVSTSVPPPPPPPPPPPAPPLPPPGYIAIPATSWANGQHPSQRGLPPVIPKSRKSLQSIVPAETMEKFLSELKTVKLRNTGFGTGSFVSPYTMRQNANSNAASLATSEISAGLESLRAGLKRKRIPEDAADELHSGLHEAVRRRFETTSPTHDVHESHEDDSFASQSSSIANSSQSHSSQNGRSRRSNDAMAISWSYPGPIRPIRAPQPEDASTSSIPAREPGLHRSLAAPPVPLPIPGQGGSDMTTPSLCSDTEVDAENEQDSLERYPALRDEVLTPPAEEDLRHVQSIAGPSKSARSPPKATNVPGRKSDLRLEELSTMSRVEVRPEEPQTRRAKPEATRISQARRVSHPPPVQGSPNVFLARQPKSPLPAQHVRKPLPPARASTARRDAVSSQQPTLSNSQASSSTFHLRSSAVILQPEPDVADGDDEPEPLTGNQAPETAAAYEEYTVPVQLSTPPLESSTLHRIPTPGLKLSQVLDPKGKRRVDDSLSLDEEIRRVSANERIADLDIDFELEGITDADILRALEADTTVYVGLGSRPKTFGYTSGGGAAGVAVTMDPGHRRQKSGDTTSKMRSRIPVPKPLSRSR